MSLVKLHTTIYLILHKNNLPNEVIHIILSYFNCTCKKLYWNFKNNYFKTDYSTVPGWYDPDVPWHEVDPIEFMINHQYEEYIKTNTCTSSYHECLCHEKYLWNIKVTKNTYYGKHTGKLLGYDFVMVLSCLLCKSKGLNNVSCSCICKADDHTKSKIPKTCLCQNPEKYYMCKSSIHKCACNHTGLFACLLHRDLKSCERMRGYGNKCVCGYMDNYTTDKKYKCICNFVNKKLYSTKVVDRLYYEDVKDDQIPMLSNLEHFIWDNDRDIMKDNFASEPDKRDDYTGDEYVHKWEEYNYFWYLP